MAMNKDDELGALWIKTTQDGRTYMTGTLNGVKVVVFSNDRKGNERAPDYRVYKSTPRGDAA